MRILSTISNLEQEFLTRFKQLGGNHNLLVREYKFMESRKFRFDFAYPGKMIAIEIEGGTFTGGRHTRGKGYSMDCEKYNLATLAGWSIFRFTSDMLRNDPYTHLMPIIELVMSE